MDRAGLVGYVRPELWTSPMGSCVDDLVRLPWSPTVSRIDNPCCSSIDSPGISSSSTIRTSMPSPVALSLCSTSAPGPGTCLSVVTDRFRQLGDCHEFRCFKEWYPQANNITLSKYAFELEEIFSYERVKAAYPDWQMGIFGHNPDTVRLIPIHCAADT